ncbi:MAG: tetratricopeptide repeat protein [Flavobacteriales bacterium]|nr:tetratricopeptide repeat protein [Flavobacteriales bacterium]
MGAAENYNNDSEDQFTSIEKYNEMLFKKKSYYFDVDEFEEIVDYYLEKQDWVKALGAIEYSKKLHPFVPSLLVKEADLLGATGQHKAALELIARIELIEHKNPELFLIKASLLSEINSTDKAINAYIRASELSCEGKDDVYISIAYEYQNQEKFENAIEYLKKALENNPANEDALYEISYCFETLDKPDQMVSFLHSFLDKHPYCDHAWNNLGSVELRQGNHHKAIEAFDYALVINEDYVAAYFNKGSALIAIEKYEDAIEIYEQSVDFDVTGSLAYHQIGYCHE